MELKERITQWAKAQAGMWVKRLWKCSSGLLRTAGGLSGDSAVFFPLKLSVTEGSRAHRWCLSCLVLEGRCGVMSLKKAAWAEGEAVLHMLLTWAKPWRTDRVAKKRFSGSEFTCLSDQRGFRWITQMIAFLGLRHWELSSPGTGPDDPCDPVLLNPRIGLIKCKMTATCFWKVWVPTDEFQWQTSGEETSPVTGGSRKGSQDSDGFNRPPQNQMGTNHKLKQT